MDEVGLAFPLPVVILDAVVLLTDDLRFVEIVALALDDYFVLDLNEDLVEVPDLIELQNTEEVWHQPNHSEELPVEIFEEACSSYGYSDAWRKGRPF